MDAHTFKYREHRHTYCAYSHISTKHMCIYIHTHKHICMYMITHIYNIHTTHTHMYSLLRYRQLTLIYRRSELMPPSSSQRAPGHRHFLSAPFTAT